MGEKQSAPKASQPQLDPLLYLLKACAAFDFTGVRMKMPETRNKPKVLIADDERVIADTLAMILNQGGFEARAVYSCVNALEIAPAFRPDMLISDVIMSELNGIEAAIRMKALLPDIHVFLLSGQTATAELLEKQNASGYGFEVLNKPLHPQDLISRLRLCRPA
jgi:CheY-like chemotaxis protein